MSNLTPGKTHIPSILQLILSISGMLISLLTAFVLIFLLLINKSYPFMSEGNIPLLLRYIGVTLVLALLALPSMILSIRNLSHQLPSKQYSRRFKVASLSLLLLIPLAFIGNMVKGGSVPVLVRALLTAFMVTIPIWWFVELGQNKLFVGTPQRNWGLIAFGVFATMPIVTLVESILVFSILGVGIFWLIKQPEFTPLLMQVQTSLYIDPTKIPDLGSHLTSLIQRPEIIATGFFGISIIIPLVEEALKPLALWFFIKKNWSPAEGFSAGLLCGAAFALIESLLASSSVSNEIWLVTICGRVGTGLLHILTTGLIGWALTSSWRDGKYLRIGWVYLASVTMHGIWNFNALLFGLNTNLTGLSFSSLSNLVAASPWILVVLLVWMTTILFAMNRKLYGETKPPQLMPQVPHLPVERME